MPTPPLAPALAAEAHAAKLTYDTVQEAAAALGLTPNTLSDRAKKHLAYQNIDPAIREAANLAGITDTNILAGFWKKDVEGHSFYIKNPHTSEEHKFSDIVSDAIGAALNDTPPKYPKRPKAKGKHLLVVDLADVHFLKLCVKTETGYEYSRDIARHRVIEGTRALLEMASNFGVGRVLFVLGNDILHVDNSRGMTTSGTPQDTDGSIFQGFSDAFSAIKDAIELCAEVADVDLIHCMSNHDWQMGWALSQAIGAYFNNHPNIHSSAYGLSESHRKYYRFENNLFGLTHGDGTKEEKLYGHVVQEARQHIAECQNIYWLLHHVHHKIRKRRGVDVFQSEKDHNGMTVLTSGSSMVEGSHANIEHVRSPSPPDGWHDRNGYVNRQGVECFLYHPIDGQKVRFTEWF